MSGFRWEPDVCAIAGIGLTDFSRGSGRSDLTLATQASMAALDDAGIDSCKVDGIVRCDMDHVQSNSLADALGIPNLSYWGDNGAGGAASGGQIGQAVAAIQAGLATTVLCFRSLNGYSGHRYGQGTQNPARHVGDEETYEEFFVPYGLTTPAMMYALIFRRHMEEYGTDAAALGEIARVCRARANTNPDAQMYGRPLEMEDYLAGRMIADPLRLFDCCLETDGAAAVVVTSTERARDLPNPPALIRSVALGTGPRVQPSIMWGALMRESLTTWPQAHAAQTLYDRAGLSPADIDVAQFYDCFTPAVLLQVEDFGFCEKGEGGDFVSSGAIDIGGSIPINTSGGHLSDGYVHGMNLVVEAVKQIRGTSTSPVENVENALVTAGPPQSSSALILGKE